MQNISTIPNTTISQTPTLLARIKQEYATFRVLIGAVPPVTLTFFVLALFAMNLMANKSIDLPYSWIALDCGFLVSWFVSLAMDMLTKHFGPKAATQLAAFATVVNLSLCLMFYLVSLVPGTWGESFVPGHEQAISTALNQTFGGTWFIIAGSTVAFLASSVVNNFLNFFVGKAFKKNPDSRFAYLTRSYVSTFFAQFVDNFLFAFLVSRTFFGWTLEQCIVCSFFGMGLELLCEAIFSLQGYKVCNRWKQNGVGQVYFDYLKQQKSGR